MTKTQKAIYSLKVIVKTYRHTHTHARLIAVPGPLKWSLITKTVPIGD